MACQHVSSMFLSHKIWDEVWTSQKLEINVDKSLKNDAGLSYQNNPNTNVKFVTHRNAFLMSLNLFLNYKTLPG